jgi:hypothetical protein
VDGTFLGGLGGGLLGKDGTAAVFSLGLSTSTRSLLLVCFCIETTASSYFIEKKCPSRHTQVEQIKCIHRNKAAFRNRKPKDLRDSTRIEKNTKA